MFTGIIEEVGSIEKIVPGTKSAVLSIKADTIMNDVRIGDSIAVNGVCLTAREVRSKGFTADVMAETLRRSSLGDLKIGGRVNLERAMLMGGRFGGHIVSGHIDGTGIIDNLKREDNAVWVTIACDGRILRYIVEKGSIAIDGISLTVAYVDDRCFKVSLIPHTASETTLLSKRVGDRVNLECDILAKYIEKLAGGGTVDVTPGGDASGTSGGAAGTSLTMETLLENGFM